MFNKKEAIDRFSNYSNTTRRYFLSVMGEYLEKELAISDDWRSKNGWKSIVQKEFKGECIYCGEKNVFFEREHLDNIAEGGLDIRGNIAPACVPCNRSKNKRLWEDFIKEKGKEKKHSKKEIQERIDRVIDHRNNSDWDKVITHPLYSNLNQMIKFLPDELNERLKGWALSWLFESQGGTEYLYHITTESDWLKVQDKGTYPVEGSRNSIIPCSYESQLESYALHRIWPGARIVILSFKKSTLSKQSIDIQKVSSCYFKDDFIQILGPINLTSVHEKSDPFIYNNASDLYKELANFQDSITSRGKKLW